ncbi:MAG: flagellar hook-associated protein FlgK [Pseudolabrys sp.]|nr:flagellar hook-associated protein FlgK [Pseudolabrys sp.]
MSLSQALISAISGLKANQSSLALVSANVANAGTAGYVRKSVNQVAVSGSGTGIGVRISAIQRELDQYVQRQLRVENSGAGYATTRAQFYNQLQAVYGTPGSDASLETAFNKFSESLQALTSSPDDTAARASVISTAQLLAQQLNTMSAGIQGLRQNAELGIADSISQANDAMQQIAALNARIASSPNMDAATATMYDQRDAYIDKLSKLMDINIIANDNNQLAIYTNSGIQLVGTTASVLSFDPQGTMSANTQWSADPNARGVGTITLTSANGSKVDLIETNAIRSGQIAAYIQMRDQDLVQAQTQLDALAAVMASALSDKTVTGTAVSSAGQDGFDIDISGLAAGNRITINYTDSLTNTPHTINLIRVDDASMLPLSDDVTATANDKVYGIDFSGGLSSVYGQIAAAIGSTGMVASNPSGSLLRVLNDGPGNAITVNSVTTTTTATALNGGSSELPFFTDGAKVFTGAITGAGAQSVGLAGRITINGALVADPSKLIVYGAGVAAGDSTRADFIYNQLTGASLQFSSATGIGSTNSPFSGSITTYLRQVISMQGQAADAAYSLMQGQDVVLSALQQRFDDTAGVNVDSEMANLMALQNSYAANARVLSAVREMLDTLMQL